MTESPGRIGGRFRLVVISTIAMQGAALIPVVLFVALQTRLLGADARGGAALLISVIFLAGKFTDFGLSAAIPFQLGNRGRDVRLILGNYLIWSACTISVVGVSVVALSTVTDLGGASNLVKTHIPQVLVVLIGLQIFGFLQSYVVGVRDYFGFNLQTFLSQAAMPAALVIFVSTPLAGDPVTIILLSYAVGYFVALLTATIRQQALITSLFHLQLSWRELIDHVSVGFKKFLSGICEQLLARLDLFIIFYFVRDLQLVGYYSVAILLLQSLNQIPGWMASTLIPKAAHGDSDAHSMTIKLAGISLMLTSIGTLVFVLAAPLAPPILEATFGSGFGQIYQLLVLMLPASIFLSMATVFEGNLAGNGYTKFHPLAVGTSLAVSILADVLLVPAFSVHGAAIARSITALVEAGIAFYGFSVVNRLSRLDLRIEIWILGLDIRDVIQATWRRFARAYVRST